MRDPLPCILSTDTRREGNFVSYRFEVRPLRNLASPYLWGRPPRKPRLSVSLEGGAASTSGVLTKGASEFIPWVIYLSS